MKDFALPLVVVVVLTSVLASGFWGDSYDDAFITYHYAQRWARGDGLTFNDGERVLGTSAPGYALALGGLDRWLGLPPPAGGSLAGLASLAVLALLLATMAPPRRRAWPPLFALTALTCRWNVEMLGAETLPAAALGALAVWLALRRDRPISAGLAMAGAILCRSDLVLPAAILGLALWRRRGKLPWAYGTASLLPPALLGVWLTAFYGSPIPATLAGKQSELADALGYGAGQWHWLGRTLTPGGRLALALLAAFGVAAWLAGRHRRAGTARNEPSGPGRRSDAALVIAAGILALQIFYRVAGVPFAPWYEIAALNGILALATYGAVEAAGLVAGRLPLVTLRPLVVGLLATALTLPLWRPGALWTAAQHGHPPDPRQPVYRALGEHLARTAEPRARVAAVEIGALGYFADRPLLDLVGLIDPAVVAARAEGRLGDHVAAVAPAYLVDNRVFRERFLDAVLSAPGVAERYRPEAAFVGSDYEGDPVFLLRRAARPTAPPSDAAPPPRTTP